jgi:hypothetical protein
MSNFFIFKLNNSRQQPKQETITKPQPQIQVQQQQPRTFVLGKTKNRLCAALQIQGNKKCGTCGGR